jgi:hypothetical protein
MVLNIKKRDMKKEAKVEYGIAIVRPWSCEMYDHNDEVAEIVKAKIQAMWTEAYEAAENELDLEEDPDVVLQDWDWALTASDEMVRIQRAVTCYGFGFGYCVGQVAETVEDEIEEAPYFRLKEMAEELGIELEQGFVGY